MSPEEIHRNRLMSSMSVITLVASMNQQDGDDAGEQMAYEYIYSLLSDEGVAEDLHTSTPGETYNVLMNGVLVFSLAIIKRLYNDDIDQVVLNFTKVQEETINQAPTAEYTVAAFELMGDAIRSKLMNDESVMRVTPKWDTAEELIVLLMATASIGVAFAIETAERQNATVQDLLQSIAIQIASMAPNN